MARAVAPFVPSLTGSMEQRMRQLSDAIGHKADQTQEPTFNAVLLVAPGGSTWRVTVSDTGVLTTAQVART